MFIHHRLGKIQHADDVHTGNRAAVEVAEVALVTSNKIAAPGGDGRPKHGFVFIGKANIKKQGGFGNDGDRGHEDAMGWLPRWAFEGDVPGGLSGGVGTGHQVFLVLDPVQQAMQGTARVAGGEQNVSVKKNRHD